MFSALVQLRAVAAIVFIVICVPAANGAGPEPSSTKRHCLWRIANGSAPCYLLGSIHVLRPSDYHSTPAIEDAIKQSQQFFFEIDPKQREAFGKKLVEAAKYPQGVQIKDKINPKTYEYLHKITVTGMGTWQHLHPWAIAVLLLRHPGFEQVSSEYGMDSYIEQKARYFSKATFGLETVDEHIRVLSDMQEVEGEVLLLQSLVYADEGPK